MTLLSLLVSILVLVIIIAVIYWIVGQMGLEPGAAKIARVIIGAIAILLLLGLLLYAFGGIPNPRLR